MPILCEQTITIKNASTGTIAEIRLSPCPVPEDRVDRHDTGQVDNYPSGFFIQNHEAIYFLTSACCQGCSLLLSQAV